ncbi:MAG: nucleotide exchange factor GrpE [Pseudobdellovibrionaceae bacterium]
MSEKSSDNANGNGATASTEPATATGAKALEEALAQVEKYKNDFLYLRAEFDNYRKNVIKERSDLVKYGSEKVFHEILNVVDNFDRALEMKISPENCETYVKGVQMTSQELKSTLSRFGVSEVSAVGSPFDPAVHEALGSEESTATPGTVTKVLRKGYKLHDRLIRPAHVMVAKTKTN